MVKNKTFGSEKYLALKGDRGGYEKVGKGHAELINNALVRPRRIHVLFTREVEVRFDFWEKFSYVSGGGFGFAANIGANQLELNKARMMYNVLPVPDWVLPHTTPPKVMGTWVTFDEALTAWNQAVKPDGVELDLDYPLIRRAMVLVLRLDGTEKIQLEKKNRRETSARIQCSADRSNPGTTRCLVRSLEPETESQS